jgi:hypothetical protein
MRALRAFALGNEIEKARIVTALARARGLAVGIAFTDIVLYARDIRGADRLARVFTKLARAPEEKALCQLVVAHLGAARGRFARAGAALHAAAALDTPWALEVRALFALLPFRAGSRRELVAVRAALEEWDAEAAPPNRNQVLAVHNGAHPALRLYLLGLVGARLGAAEEALSCAATLERTALSGLADGFRAHLANSIRAHAAASSGDLSAALRLLERARLELWYQLTVTSPFYGAAYDRFQRAELLRATGRADEALAWYRALGESSPYELVYLAPAKRRLEEIGAPRPVVGRG